MTTTSSKIFPSIDINIVPKSSDLNTEIFFKYFTLKDMYSILMSYFPLKTLKLNLPFKSANPPYLAILSFCLKTEIVAYSSGTLDSLSKIVPERKIEGC